MVAVGAMAVLLASCGVQGGTDVRSPLVGDTTTTTEAPPTTTTTAPPPKAEAVPWEDVVAAAEAPIGRVEREVMAQRPSGSGGEAADGFLFQEYIEFDQDQGMVSREITGATSKFGLPEGPLRTLSADGRNYFSTFLMAPACPAPWVPVDDQAGPAISSLYEREAVIPIEPLRTLTEATPDLPPTRVDVSGTSWKVDVPATAGLPPGFANRYPAVWKALAAQKITADVDFDGAGLTVSMQLSEDLIAAAGGYDAGAVPKGALVGSHWNLDPTVASNPPQLSEPTDVAADSSCLGG